MLLSNPQRRFVNLFTQYIPYVNPDLITILEATSGDIATIPSFNVIVDSFVMAALSITSVKGAVDGRTEIYIHQDGGSGVLEYLQSGITLGDWPRPALPFHNHTALGSQTLQGYWLMRASASGDVDLKVYGSATGSNATIIAGYLAAEFYLFL